MANMQEVRIVCVVVTFNRLEKLKKAIYAYEKQSMPFDTLVIVDNHSTDGTEQYLEEWGKTNSKLFNKHVIHLQENRGGSGGFYEGEKYAMTLNPDWIFVADDDAYPEEKMIEKFVSYINFHNTDHVSALCASVVDANGNISLDHRSRHHIYRSGYFGIIPIPQEEYQKESFELTMFSYVGTLMNVKALRKVGLVNPKLFIYADDGEHSLRLKKVGKIVCFPQIRIMHDCGAKEVSLNDDILASWRDYYLIRNQFNLYRKHSFFSLPMMVWSTLRTCNYQCSEKKHLVRMAIWNGIIGILGIHSKYKPGWEVRRN